MIGGINRIPILARSCCRCYVNSGTFVPTGVAMFSSEGHGMGELGSGAGRGGGAGGSVRSAGGIFGKIEQAREEEYFRRLQKLQLKNLHEQLDDEVEYHEHQLKHHQQAIERHKKRMSQLKHEEKELENHGIFLVPEDLK